MHEIELKFQIPESRYPGLQRAFTDGPTEAIRMQARYHDTVDGLLARHEIALRLRLEGERWVQTLKASAEHGVARLEHNAELPPGTVKPALDIERHRASPAYARLVDVLGEVPAEGVLHEVFRTEVDRLVRVFKGPGGAVIEGALDTGRVVSRGAVHPLREIEFEWKAGPLPALFALASQWVDAHGLWLDVVSKAERGTLLGRGLDHPAAEKAAPPRLRGDEDGPAFARAAVGGCLAQVLRNASAVAGGSRHPGHVHQLRIGLRRLRVALRELAPLDCGLDPGWELPLAEVFRALGVDRDRQILEHETADVLLVAGAPPLTHPALPGGSVPAAAVPPDARVRGVAFQQVLLAAQAFAMGAAPMQGAAHEGEALPALIERLDALHRRLALHAARFVGAPPEVQHALRKELKRLRYLAEFVTPAFRARRVARWLDALEPAQQALGRHNDQAVALAAYRGHAAREPAAWFAVGWLTAQQAASERAARKALKRACSAEPFWRGKAAVRPD